MNQNYILISLFVVALALLLLIIRTIHKSKNKAASLLNLQTHFSWGQQLRSLLSNKNAPTEILSGLESLLLQADVGPNTTGYILSQLQQNIKKWDLETCKMELTNILQKILNEAENKTRQCNKPEVILMVGVNGVGKTTTIGKLAHRFIHQEKKQVLLAAGDTFRAGAIAQLKVWAERNACAIVAQQEGSDAASVAFDAVTSGLAKQMDIVLIDTAGRLQSKSNLMEELKKVKRVIGKAKEGAPEQTYLVIDAVTGQNALSQAREFHEAVGLTGIILTKWDSTAKGGMVLAIAHELQLPIIYVGLGEKIEDIQIFNMKKFIQQLIDE